MHIDSVASTPLVRASHGIQKPTPLAERHQQFMQKNANEQELAATPLRRTLVNFASKVIDTRA